MVYDMFSILHLQLSFLNSFLTETA